LPPKFVIIFPRFPRFPIKIAINWRFTPYSIVTNCSLWWLNIAMENGPFSSMIYPWWRCWFFSEGIYGHWVIHAYIYNITHTHIYIILYLYSIYIYLSIYIHSPFSETSATHSHGSVWGVSLPTQFRSSSLAPAVHSKPGAASILKNIIPICHHLVA
jgi:hypothetical protein